jgi:hypothetical protein
MSQYIQADTTVVNNLLSRFEFTSYASLVAARTVLAQAIRLSMQHPQCYTAIPLQQQLPAEFGVDNAAQYVHPWNIAAALMNVCVNGPRFGGEALAPQEDLQIHLDTWRFLQGNTFPTAIVPMAAPPAPEPAPAPAPITPVPAPAPAPAPVPAAPTPAAAAYANEETRTATSALDAVAAATSAPPAPSPGPSGPMAAYIAAEEAVLGVGNARTIQGLNPYTGLPATDATTAPPVHLQQPGAVIEQPAARQVTGDVMPRTRNETLDDAAGGMPDPDIRAQRTGGTGRPQKSPFEKKVEPRSKIADAPFWWKTIVKTASKILTQSPASALDADSTGAGPVQSYMVAVALLQEALKDVPPHVTVASLRNYLREVDGQVSELEWADAANQIRKELMYR